MTRTFDLDDPREWVPAPAGRHFYVDGSVTAQTLAAALDAIRDRSRPMPKAQIAEGVGECMLACKRRTLNDADTRATINLYATRLMEFPADLVRDVLHQWPLHNDWFPSLNELAHEIRVRNWRGVAATRIGNIIDKNFGSNPAKPQSAD